MFYDKPFQVALLISTFLHSLILLGLPNIKSITLPTRRLREIQVTYFHNAALDKEVSLKATTLNRLKTCPNLRTSQIDKLGPLVKDISFSKGESALKREISVKEVDKKDLPTKEEISKQANYINYYNLIRERIRCSAYKNYRYESAKGEVYLSFVVKSQGQLKNARIIHEKSNAGSFLKDVALRSLFDAAPFPAFPKELNAPELTFSVIISFEISK